MITISETNNLLKRCFCSPCFELLWKRIRVLIKFISFVKNDAGTWDYLTENEEVKPLSKEITDLDYIDPVTKKLYQTVTKDEAGNYFNIDGVQVYPAYSKILSTKFKEMFSNWETLTKEEIGEYLVYVTMQEHVEAYATANNWHIKE